ncbi:MAG: hypothetical protein MAG453_00807 [Calditrichaeota bacterium]|nr:hypothetical protein [Calditrichota bacterium]
MDVLANTILFGVGLIVGVLSLRAMVRGDRQRSGFD